MGALTEQEIFSQMVTSFRTAAECCDDLASRPESGPIYAKLRVHLKLVEGCCRQASVWREDTRWLPLGRMMAEAHQKAGDWLRAHYARRVFSVLADVLRKGALQADLLRTQKTGRSGMILPAPRAHEREKPRHQTVTLPAGMTRTPGGLLLPQ